MFSRNEKVLNKRFPKVVDALASLGSDFVLDGELVAFDPQGRPSFQLLQNNQSRALPVYFYAFDLLNRDREPLVRLAIERRRELLGRLLAAAEDPLRLSPLLRASSGQVLEAVRKLGLEGVVGKRIAFTYEPGERSGAWIKHRANREQEFVIGGYIPGTHGFDALLVGATQGKLRPDPIALLRSEPEMAHRRFRASDTVTQSVDDARSRQCATPNQSLPGLRPIVE